MPEGIRIGVDELRRSFSRCVGRVKRKRLAWWLGVPAPPGGPLEHRPDLPSPGHPETDELLDELRRERL